MPKPQGTAFQATFQYVFPEYGLDLCAHCRKPSEAHAEGKCLFESTQFKAHELDTFFRALLKKGGTLTLTAGKQTLRQKVKAQAVDRRWVSLSGQLTTTGEAFLGEADAEER
jgi:stage V sporulation protein SpoVS